MASGDGTKRVDIEVRDGAGRVTAKNDSIVLDTVLPTGTIKINNNAIETSTRNVTLNLTASDSRSGVDQVRFSTDGAQTWGAWENFASSKAFTIPAGDGFRSVDYQVRDVAGNIFTAVRDDIVVETGTTPEAPPVLNPGGVFTLALDDTILADAASDGAVGYSLALTDKFYDTYGDLYDFLIFVPSLNGSRRLSLEKSNNASENNNGSFYLGAFNDIQGIGDDIYNFRSFFGAPSNGELEGMVLLDSALTTETFNRFGSSDFTNAGNQTFFNNILTQEIAHRYGSFLTSSDNDPLGIIGRQLAHWDVFFDANFSPMDGNDWTDNGDGTFTMTKSYIGQIAGQSATRANPMPYNDLDLYSMGFLEADQVGPMFMIDNPRLTDGRAIRATVNNPANSKDAGPFVDIQESNGTWNGPFYLPNNTVVQGTRRNLTLADIQAYEGARNPTAAAAPKTFKVGFIGVTDETENSNALSAFLTKLKNFQDQFINFFKTQARNLGELSLPSLGLPGGGSGAASMGGATGFGGSISGSVHGITTREEFIEEMNEHLGAEEQSMDLTNIGPVKLKDQNQVRRDFGKYFSGVTYSDPIPSKKKKKK